MNARRKYIIELKRLMYFGGKKEKKFISDFNNDIKEFVLSDTSKNNYEQICHEFGTPLENFSEYLLGYDNKYLYKRLKIKRILISIAITIGVAMIIVLGFSMHYYQKAYQKSMEANIYGFTNEIEIIDEK